MDAFLKRVACAFVTFGLVFVLPIACKGGLLDDVEREIARDDANSPFVFTPSDKMAFSTTEQKVYLESDVEITTIADIKNDTRQNLTATLEIDEKDKVLFENAPELTSATCVDEVSFKFKFRANAEGKEAYVRIRLTKASGGEFGVKEGWIRCNSRPAVPEVTFVGGTDKIKIEKPTAGSFEDIKDVIVTVFRSDTGESVKKCEKKYRLSDLPVELKMYKTSTAQGLFDTAVDGRYSIHVEAIDAVGLSSSGQTENNISYMRHNVTFFANGGKAVPQQLVIKGDKATKPEVSYEVSYPEHSLVGWYQDVGYTSQWDFGEPVEKDLLLYAKWNSTATSTAVVKINGAEVSESEAWKMLKAEVAKPSVSSITINGKIKATSDAGNNGVIQVNKTLIIKGTDKDSDVLDASNLSGIFAVTTNGYLELSNLTLRNGKLQDTDEQSGGGAIYCEGSIFLRDGIIITECQDNRLGADKGMGGAVYCKNTSKANHAVALTNTVIKNCTASNGGGIAVFGTTSAETSCEIGKGVEISGCTLLSTSGKGKAVYIKGKGILDISETAHIASDNDVYIDENCYIRTTAELQYSAPVLTLTPYKYETDIEFVKGKGAYREQNAPKFAVTPQKVEGGDVNYTINTDGKLKLSSNIKINNETVGEANAWKALKDAVENSSIGDTITINGSIKATFVHKGVIKVNRKLTIKGTNKANDILDADNFSGIFEITEDGELTLENLTLQNGYLSALDAQPGGGAIYCCGKLTTNYVVIKNCHDKRNRSKNRGVGYGGAIYAKKVSEGKECKATLTNTEIEKCSAWCGGGIAVADGAICSIGDEVHIKSCEFSNSSSSEHYGKAVFLKTEKNKQGSILQIGGSLDIPTNGKHDVYISKSCYIEIISDLTGKANAVLTLTPYEYNTDIEFVKGEFRKDNVSKLDVTAYKGVDYRINTDGKLVKK
jgi:hypothetical protein